MTYFKSKKMHGDSIEMREMAARICRDYLHGAWKKVTAQNIGFKHISGGLSNLLYHISLPESLIKEGKHENEPNEVLIRVYGQTHGEKALEALITDSVIFTLLSERGLGPKLHGIFPGGRIEQYINARPLLTKELADKKLSTIIAKKMALIHSMEVPLHKEPGWLWDTIDNWLKTCHQKYTSECHVPDFAREMIECDLRDEAKWLRQRLESEKSPVVFSHNDMQEGNILICQDSVSNNNNANPEIVLIDFEYCSYNYRAFDFANHFVEWTYDYTAKEHPYFKETPEDYPTEQQRLRFIRTYLKETGSKENPAKILQEVRVFSLATHFFWTLWSIVNADTSQIPFGYWEYGVARFNRYMNLKQELAQQTLPLPLKRKAAELD